MNKTKNLERELIKHKSLYYQGKAVISDEEYDALENELKSIDPSNPVLSIVGSAQFYGEKVEHAERMLSLNKTYKINELVSWMENFELISTFKIDGSSCSLIYNNGLLELAKTRGDGQFGENITNKVLFLDTIPQKVLSNDRIEIRGEIYCNEKDFVHLSEEMSERGLDKPSSMRNIVAGILGRKENIDLAKFLSFQAFELIEDKKNLKKESEKFKKLKEMKFETPETYLNTSQKDIQERIEEAKEFMGEGEYLIDGLVFTYNNLSTHEELGNTAHHPRYKMAFKFQGEVKDTKVEGLHWGVSRNGILTPVAQVEPIKISGAIVSNVTLHNFGMAKQNNVKAGDVIKIVRSGEVIPKFLEVVSSSNNKFEYPVNCPSCNTPTVINDIRLICENDKCPAKVKDSILNFIKKMNIEDLSDKRLEELIKLKYVDNIASLYELTIETLMKMDKVKEKLASKIISNIENSKNTELAVFLSALGVSGAAINKCEKIVEHGHDSIEKVFGLTSESLTNVDGFAEKSAKDFVKSISEKKELITKLIKSGIVIKGKISASDLLSGKRFCFTGTLTRKRNELEGLVKKNGGLNSSSVSKNTDFLVTNDKESASSKFKKANSLDIPIIDEDTFLEMIGEK